MEIPAIHGIFLYLLIIGIACLLTGAWLIRRGWLPRRRGQTPHCRRCNYILAGISADRCPECGTTLGPRTTVIGERRRRPLLGSVGLLLALLGVATTTATLTSRFREIDWYTYRPTSWVITDLRSPNPRIQSRAWDLLRKRMDAGTFDETQRGALDDELIRLGGLRSQFARDSFYYLSNRYRQLSPANQQALYKQSLAELLRGNDEWIYELRMGKNLSGPQQKELLELAVAEFEAPQPAGSGHDELIGFLQRPDWVATLTDKQRQRILSHIGATLEVRPTGIVGQLLPCKIGIPTHWSWTRTFEVSDVRIDGQSTSAFRDAPTAYDGPPGRSLQIDLKEAGRHTLDVLGTVKLSAGEVQWTRDVHLTARFESLAANASQGVTWLEDPSLSKSLSERISMATLDVISNGRRCVLPVTLANLPADVSFEIIVRSGETETPIGEIAGAKGETSTHGIFNDNPLRDLGVNRVDIVLRSNPHPALQTINVLRPWKGTLVYRNVPVVGENE